jgi:hypothetical protein
MDTYTIYTYFHVEKLMVPRPSSPSGGDIATPLVEMCGIQAHIGGALGLRGWSAWVGKHKGGVVALW